MVTTKVYNTTPNLTFNDVVMYVPIEVSLRAGHRANRQVVRMILPGWFDNQEESIIILVVQVKWFCPPL